MSAPTFVTLGPHGTCHENAVLHYRDFQGLPDAPIEFIDDFLVGADRIRGRENAFLVQCSAHPDVHLVTERYRHEVFVVDSFLFPAKEMALLARTDVDEPKSLGIVSAARGYVDLTQFESVTEQTANPIVAERLLDGTFDAGVTFHDYAVEHPDRLRVIERFGIVDTSWVVYGTRRRGNGELAGQRIPHVLTGSAAPPGAGGANLPGGVDLPDGFGVPETDVYPAVRVGDGYAVGHLDEIGCGYGFRKLRRAVGVTAFGINALVRPTGYTASRHRHAVQEELYFVHRGAVEIEFADRSVHRLNAGGFARVDAGTVRQLRTVGDGDGDVVYLCAGGSGGYVGRDGIPSDWPTNGAD